MGSMIPRGASLSDSCTSDRCCFSSLVNNVALYRKTVRKRYFLFQNHAVPYFHFYSSGCECVFVAISLVEPFDL